MTTDIAQKFTIGKFPYFKIIRSARAECVSVRV